MSLWMTTTFFCQKYQHDSDCIFFCMILLVNLAAAAVVLGEVTVCVLPDAIAGFKLILFHHNINA